MVFMPFFISSVENPELDASFNESDTIASSVSSGFLHLVPFLIALN